LTRRATFSLTGAVDSMRAWLADRLGILDRIELAPHVDGAWTGRVFVIVPGGMEVR